MTKSTLESLPNELLIVIFSYLSAFDLYLAFNGIENVRIKQLFTSLRRLLDVSTMHYGEIIEFLNSLNDEDTTNSFTSLINTVAYHKCMGTYELHQYWEKKLENDTSSNVLLSSIEKLFIFMSEPYAYYTTDSFLKRLITFNNSLQYLHLTFESPTYHYTDKLYELMRHEVSVHTMILEIENGM